MLLCSVFLYGGVGSCRLDCPGLECPEVHSFLLGWSVLCSHICWDVVGCSLLGHSGPGMMFWSGFSCAKVRSSRLGCPLLDFSNLHSSVLSWSVLCRVIGWPGSLCAELSCSLPFFPGVSWTCLFLLLASWLASLVACSFVALLA